jgi:tetratricopeptide (TPR) repeat protein
VQPDYVAFSLRGDAFFAQGDYDHAIDDYLSARRADSQVARAYLLRSEKLKADGQVEQASADFERAVSLDPSLSPEDAARLQAAQPTNTEAPRELPPLPDDVQALPEDEPAVPAE